MPFRTPGSDLPGAVAFAARGTGYRRLSAARYPLGPGALASTTELGSPSTRPFARGISVSLNLGVPFADFCNRIRRADDAYEPSVLARE